MTSEVPTLKFVSNSRELREVGRFRYTVYVEEMGRPQPAADHAQSLILDSLDLNAFVLAAWLDGRVVGTCRINFCGMSDIGPYAAWYRAVTVAGRDWPEGTAVLTRLMVSSELRGSMLGAKLATAAFQLGRSRGIGRALMDCNEHLLGFFSKLGWRLIGPFEHPDYGTVFAHWLDLADLAHLERVKSPFLRALRRTAADDWLLVAQPIGMRTLQKAAGSLLGRPDAMRRYRPSTIASSEAA